MDFNQVKLAEAEFRRTGLNRYKLEAHSSKIPGEEVELEVVHCDPKDGFTGYYYNQKDTKEKIVLHFTVGHLKGDISSLTSKKRGHVSTPFVIARDGTIYRLFSSANWSYHLGRKALGGNQTQSRKSIGIEISNYGPLFKKGNELHTYYSSAVSPRNTKKDVYCTLDDTDQYIKLPKKFRNIEYFTKFTDEQYHSIIVLLRYLTTAYKIPRKFVDEASRFKTVSSASSQFKGICSHVNFRTDKSDIGPAFDWDRVIAGVTADVYTGNVLEAAVEKAKQDVATAQQGVEAAKAALTTAEATLTAAEAALEAAQNALENAEVVSRRAVSTFSEADEPEVAAITDETIHGEDGPEPFEIDRSSFYDV
ncbi:MAG: N-acetylmuramoyl-L-alanine amidase [Saprospiraceae bacterium]